jgi:hypothetical protein
MINYGEHVLVHERFYIPISRFVLPRNHTCTYISMSCLFVTIWACGERLSEVITENISLTPKALSNLTALGLGCRPGVSDEKAGQVLPMVQGHQKPPD